MKPTQDGSTVYDVSSFCASHRISRSFFYKLLAEGRGPRLMKLGRRTLVSAEAAAEWRAKMEEREGTPQASLESAERQARHEPA